MNASWFRKVSGQLGFSSQTPYCAVQLFLVGFLSVDVFTLAGTEKGHKPKYVCQENENENEKKTKKQSFLAR